jgi:hypothetical protein
MLMDHEHLPPRLHPLPEGMALTAAGAGESVQALVKEEVPHASPRRMLGRLQSSFCLASAGPHHHGPHLITSLRSWVLVGAGFSALAGNAPMTYPSWMDRRLQLISAEYPPPSCKVLYARSLSVTDGICHLGDKSKSVL